MYHTGNASQTPEQTAGLKDKSPCKYLDRKNEILAYSWRLSRAMVLGNFTSLQCPDILLICVIEGQVSAVLAAGGWCGM